MKTLLLVVLLTFIVGALHATNYYFSAAGNDSYTSAQASNPATPWKTITKLNSYFSSLIPGDSVLFRRGDTFVGAIVIGKSGTSSAPIVIGAYGSGNKPVITSYIPITNWVSVGGGIWKASNAAFGSSLPIVAVNDKVTPMGRYPNLNQPNKGYLTITSHVSNTSITSTALSSTPSFVGGEVVIRKRFWMLDKCPITAHSGGTISYTDVSNTAPMDGYGFFIQNHIKTLDQMGEWCYTASTKTINMFFGSASPASVSVKVAIGDNLVYGYLRSFINFVNLDIEGGATGIQVIGGNNINVANCDFSALGDGVSTYPNTTNNMKVTNSTFNWVINHGMRLITSNSLVENNTFKNIGSFAGLGGNGNGGLKAIHLSGASNMIRYNVVDTVGYTAIRFDGGSNNVVQNNFVRYFCFVKDDGAGIYTFKSRNATTTFTGMKVIGNIVLEGVGVPEGVANPGLYVAAHGIYMDSESQNVEISGNTAANCFGAGIFLHNATNIVIKGNTCYNNQNNQTFVSYDDISFPATTGLQVHDNINFAKYPDQLVAKYSSAMDNISAFGVFDYNYYCRPLNNRFSVNSRDPLRTETNDIPVWATKYGKDFNSKPSPVTFPAYTINGFLSGNKFTNGAFNSNINGTGVWNPAGTVRSAWISGGKLDGGAIKISYTATGTTSSPAVVAIPIGGLTAGKKYIFRCSAIGSKQNGSMLVWLRQGTSPFASITPSQLSYTSTTRTEHEFMFTVPVSAASAGLAIQLNDLDGTTYLDNIQLVEADVSVTDPNEVIRFEYNNTKSPLTFSLATAYRDSYNQVYTNSVTLAPFTSIVLMRDATLQVLANYGLDFSSSTETDGIKLRWAANNETGINYYELEKSVDGRSFEPLTRVTASGKSEYFFLDKHPIQGRNVYRLKMVSFTGDTTIRVLVATFNGLAAELSVYPNPVLNMVQLTGASLMKTDPGYLTIKNLNGMILISRPIEFIAGTASVDMSSLNPGMYFLTVNTHTQKITRKLIKQ